MAEGTFVAYYRVSTEKLGRSGLGLDAQLKAVEDYLNGGKWDLAAEFTEIESGKNSDRPALAKALQACRVYGARLVIAKLDRLSRDAHFLLGLEKAGVDFVAADMPHANRLTVGIMAMVADEERRMISARTRAALAEAKKRGKKLGGFRGKVITPEARAASLRTRQERSQAKARDLVPIIEELKAAGAISLRQIAAGLNAKGIKTARGGEWSAGQVQRLIERV